MLQQAQLQHRPATRSQRTVLFKPLGARFCPQAAVTHQASQGETIATMAAGAPPKAADSTAAWQEVICSLRQLCDTARGLFCRICLSCISFQELRARMLRERVAFEDASDHWTSLLDVDRRRSLWKYHTTDVTSLVECKIQQVDPQVRFEL